MNEHHNESQDEEQKEIVEILTSPTTLAVIIFCGTEVVKAIIGFFTVKALSRWWENRKKRKAEQKKDKDVEQSDSGVSEQES